MPNCAEQRKRNNENNLKGEFTNEKLLVFTMALAIALSLTACGGNTTEPSTAPASSTAPSSQSASVPNSTTSASTVTNSKYKIEVKLLDDKKAAIVIGGAVPTSGNRNF